MYWNQSPAAAGLRPLNRTRLAHVYMITNRNHLRQPPNAPSRVALARATLLRQDSAKLLSSKVTRFFKFAQAKACGSDDGRSSGKLVFQGDSCWMLTETDNSPSIPGVRRAIDSRRRGA